MKCFKKDCKNEAIVYPKILAIPKGYRGEPPAVVPKIPLCFTCKSKMTLKSLATDLGDGGINPCLYKYLAPYISGLTKEEYQRKYHNILEYLLKQLKRKIAKELR